MPASCSHDRHRPWQPRIALLALLAGACSEGSPGDSTRLNPAELLDGEAETEPSGPAPEAPGLSFEGIDLPGVAAATDFAFLPSSRGNSGPLELLALSLTGEVHHLMLGRDQALGLGTTTLPVYLEGGCGLHSIALDPSFAQTGQLYLTRCLDTRSSRLSRHTYDVDTVLAPGEEDILTVSTPSDPLENWHRFGSFGFEPDGETLWVLLGDHFFRDGAQDTSAPFGSLLRIVLQPPGSATAYVSAPGNALDTPPIYAHGLRSPWRGTRDRRGRFFVGDVGEYRREEVNLVTHAGQNFGWPAYEGPCTGACAFDDPLTHYGRTLEDRYVLEDPDAASGTGRAVWVGEVYEAPSRDRYSGLFEGKVVFGDFFTGWVRLLAVDAEGRLSEDVLVGHLPQVTSWHTGPDGYMYALTLSGTLYRAKPIVGG